MQQCKGENPCRSVISIKLQSIFIETTLRHECSPVNLLHIFRTPFTKNTSGRLLLDNASDTEFHLMHQMQILFFYTVITPPLPNKKAGRLTCKCVLQCLRRLCNYNSLRKLLKTHRNCFLSRTIDNFKIIVSNITFFLKKKSKADHSFTLQIKSSPIFTSIHVHLLIRAIKYIPTKR